MGNLIDGVLLPGSRPPQVQAALVGGDDSGGVIAGGGVRLRRLRRWRRRLRLVTALLLGLELGGQVIQGGQGSVASQTVLVKAHPGLKQLHRLGGHVAIFSVVFQLKTQEMEGALHLPHIFPLVSWPDGLIVRRLDG